MQTPPAQPHPQTHFYSACVQPLTSSEIVENLWPQPSRTSRAYSFRPEGCVVLVLWVRLGAGASHASQGSEGTLW